LPAEFPHALIRVEEIVFGPPAGADVAVRFSGPDPVILRQLADEATSIFEDAGTITNPRTNWRQREILIEPVVDESRMRLAGATRSAIADTIRFGTSGLRVGELREGDEVVPILLRLPESERDGIGHVRDLSVWSAGAGSYVPMANVVEQQQRPTIVMAPNKTLAAQLYGEFKAFFPDNAVEYFVSYYDYYQPEAYVPSSDTFIEKDASINDHIEQMRLSATKALLERRDALIVVSVSAIYGLGDPDQY